MDVAPDPGNVLRSREEHNGLRGGHGNALLAIGANVVELARRRVQGG